MERIRKHPLRGAIMLLSATVIWGLAFVAQSEAMDYLDVLTYNGVRILLGGIALIPAVLLFHRFDPAYRELTKADRKKQFRMSLIGGCVTGLFMGVAATLQQYGIAMTSAGKSGFLTALYIVLVPIVGVVLSRRVRPIAALCVLIALIGSYFLCIRKGQGFSIETGDWVLLGCALFFSFQILSIDWFLERGADPVLSTCIEFLFAGVVLLPLMFLFETPRWADIWTARYTILYAGVLSGSVGYGLQMLGQREIEPTAASLLMCLESVFAALFGWLLLNEHMTGRELLGCGLVFLAVILSQLPERKR